MSRKPKRIKYKKGLTPSQKLIAGFYRLLQPKPKLSASAWIERNHVLSVKEGAAEPGLYSFTRTPFMREPVDCFSANSKIKEVYFLKSSQIGVSTAAFGVIGYFIDYIGGNLLYTMPSDKVLQRASRGRVDPFIKSSPVLAPLFSDRNAKDKTNNTLEKEYDAGTMYLASAQSPNDLASVTCRMAISDEASRFPQNVGGEGSAITLIENRLNTFGARSKHFLLSTPTIEGECLVSEEYNYTDKRQYFMNCPHCTEEITFDFDNLKWGKKEDGRHDTSKVWYECPACEEHIDEKKHKTKMMAGGKWIATEKDPEKKNARGYSINALYSPIGWLSWNDIAAKWVKGHKKKESRIAFYNTILGLPFSETNKETPQVDKLMLRRETYPTGIVPKAARNFALVAGADVQADRLEITVKAVGMRADKTIETYIIDHRVFYGNVINSDVNKEVSYDSISGKEIPNAWEQFYQYVKTPFAVEGEKTYKKPLISVGIDSGFKSTMVYQFVKRFPARLVHAVKGRDNLSNDLMILPPKLIDYDLNGKKVKKGAILTWVSNFETKEDTYNSLNVDAPTAEYLKEVGSYPARYVHFPMLEKDYFKQLTAEQKRSKFDKQTGRKKSYYYNPPDVRNEALDCFCYGTAAWHIRKLNEAEPGNYVAIVDLYENNTLENWGNIK